MAIEHSLRKYELDRPAVDLRILEIFPVANETLLCIMGLTKEGPDWWEGNISFRNSTTVIRTQEKVSPGSF